MATVTGKTAAAIDTILDDMVIDATVDGAGDLILTQKDLTTINAGNVIGPTGATGATGPGAGPAGGSTGQILAKASGTDHDFVWQNYLRAIVQNTQAANYTLVSGDEEDMVLCDHATTAIAVTVPANATTAFPLGTRIRVAQINDASVNIAAAGGVSILYPDTITPTLLGKGAVVELIKIATDTWLLTGDLATTELGWETYVPTLKGSTTDPNLGTGPVKKGYFLLNNQSQVFGGATVRWGSGTNQGSGYIFCTLPKKAINYDDLGYSPIGSVSLGLNTVLHRTGLLHVDGITPSPWRGYVALDNALTYTNSVPGNVGNVHWHFTYQHDPT